MKLKIKKLHPDAKIPQYATEGAAGLDLTCVRAVEVVTYVGQIEGIGKNKHYVRCDTGLAFEIPKGYVGLLFPRSSVFMTGLSMANCVGVIDSDYRGEVSALFYQDEAQLPDGRTFGIGKYKVGDRCCQMVIVKLPEVEIEEVDELSDTERGTGGYGSTGR